MEEIQAAKEARWAVIKETPSIKISPMEYQEMPDDLKALAWKICWKRNWNGRMEPYYLGPAA
jgi:hypothetical protein